jgi:hypothetical protein
MYWLLNKLFGLVDYSGIDKEKMNEWMLNNSLDKGFSSYFKYRDLAILKQMGQGLKTEDYWKLVGQRYELLLLAGKVKEAKDMTERKKKEKEKQEVETLTYKT